MYIAEFPTFAEHRNVATLPTQNAVIHSSWLHCVMPFKNMLIINDLMLVFKDYSYIIIYNIITQTNDLVTKKKFSFSFRPP